MATRRAAFRRRPYSRWRRLDRDTLFQDERQKFDFTCVPGRLRGKPWAVFADIMALRYFPAWGNNRELFLRLTRVGELKPHDKAAFDRVCMTREVGTALGKQAHKAVAVLIDV